MPVTRRGSARPHRLLWAVLSALTLIVGSLAPAAPFAAADTAPPSGQPATVSADALSTVQVDGVVWAQVTVGNTVYATGSFAYARPAGTPANSASRVARGNLLAYDITTGNLITSFAHTLNVQGHAMAASPDGSRLYVGGDFTSVDGQTRNRVAAFDTATGALLPAFAPAGGSSGGVNNEVRGLAATNSTVYVGGSFTSANGVSRSRLAAFTSAGSLLSWNPGANSGVNSMVMAPDQSRVVVGGSFTTLAGADRNSVGAVLVSGAAAPWSADFPIKNGGGSSTILSLAADATTVYGSGYYYMRGGNFEGRFAVDPNTGTLVWMNSCHGDSYSVYPVNGVVYSASHEHDCSDLGLFNQDQSDTFASTHYFAAAESAAPASTPLQAPVFGGMYASFAGRPHSTQLDWYPRFTPGTYTGQSQSAWSVTGNSSYVSYGGEFPTVNGTAQSGLVRFAVAGSAPNHVGPEPFAAPTVSSVASGTVRVGWQADWDRDNSRLTYAVLRDGGSTPINTQSYASFFWSRQFLGYTDTGLSPGSSHTYRVRVTDPFGNTVLSSTSAAVTVSAATQSSYESLVQGDGAQHYWPLSESGGTTAVDRAGFTDLTLRSAVSFGTAGPVAANGSAATFAGSSSSTTMNGPPGAPPRTVTTSNSVASSLGTALPLSTFTLEAWVRTTSSSGGIVVSDSLYQPTTPDGSESPVVDRVLYLGSDGRPSFGVISHNVKETITSPGAVNDGRWHHLAATVGGSGAELFLDGSRVAANSTLRSDYVTFGHWRLGGDGLSGWTPQPASGYLAGAIADVAVYPTVLSGSQLSAHVRAAGGTTPPANNPPTASFSASCPSLTCSFDGRGSADSDGTIGSYAWDFGDGTTGSGSAVSHTYAAGTYVVRLTVTDNSSATGTATRSVSPAAAPTGTTFVSDTFNRTVSNGWGTADQGGTWTAASASQFSVTPGNGRLSIPAGATHRATLDSTTSSNTDLTATLSIDKLPSAGSAYLSLIGRRVTTNQQYDTQLAISTSGTVNVSLLKLNGSSTAAVVSAPVRVSGLTYSAGARLNVRFQATGTSPTSLRAKVWAAGSSEPDSWSISATDSSAGIQAAGSVGVKGYLSSSAANAPITMSLTALTARGVG